MAEIQYLGSLFQVFPYILSKFSFGVVMSLWFETSGVWSGGKIETQKLCLTSFKDFQLVRTEQ